MWILESDGDFLQGKRYWLRPGKKHLIGRHKKGEISHGIDHSSISRKHLSIEVASVTLGDGSLLHTRSKLTVTDLESKLGTRLDGRSLKGSKELDRDEHTFKLGNHEHLLRIKWVPVVFTFSFSTKETKNQDPLTRFRACLEDLDIKVVDSYVVTKTTHVVQSKRNTVKGLQALVNGKYIVTQSYVDAVVYAATPDDLEQPENLSPLERDFDAAWPDATQYLPSPGKEPSIRPAVAFAPTIDRTHVFEHFVFIFCDQEQYESLQAPISNGHGKALLYNLDWGKTTVDELAEYMQNAGGSKGFGKYSSQLENGGVVLVRMHKVKAGFEDWIADLYFEVTRRLEQLPVEQGGFLDAILGNDAKSLRRLYVPDSVSEVVGSSSRTAIDETSLEITKTPGGSGPRQSFLSRSSIERGQSPKEETTAPVATARGKPVRPRTTGTSRFKTFDDGFDMIPIPEYTVGAEESDSNVPDDPISGSANKGSEADNGHSAPQGRKRSAPISGPSDDEVAEDLLPAANAMKRRRCEIEAENRRLGKTTAPENSVSTQKNAKQSQRKQNHKDKDIDVREAARDRREKEDAAAAADRETLEHALDSMDIEHMKHLAVVEEMPIPVRADRRSRTAEDEHDDRWDERWNGRKNFKKFRRVRDINSDTGARERRAHLQSLIVPLEEVKRKMYGIGEVYWEESPRNKTKEKNKSQSSVTLTQSSKPTQARETDVPADEEDMVEAQTHPTSPTTARVQEEAVEIVGAIDLEQPRQTRLSDKTQQSQQVMKIQSQRKRASSLQVDDKNVKRPKTRIATAARAQPHDEDSDSGDELKFRFGRRRKG